MPLILVQWLNDPICIHEAAWTKLVPWKIHITKITRRGGHQSKFTMLPTTLYLCYALVSYEKPSLYGRDKNKVTKMYFLKYCFLIRFSKPFYYFNNWILNVFNLNFLITWNYFSLLKMICFTEITELENHMEYAFWQFNSTLFGYCRSPSNYLPSPHLGYTSYLHWHCFWSIEVNLIDQNQVLFALLCKCFLSSAQLAFITDLMRHSSVICYARPNQPSLFFCSLYSMWTSSCLSIFYVR